MPGRQIGVAIAGEVLPKRSLRDPEARDIVRWLFFEEWIFPPPCFELPFQNKMPREVRHLYERGAIGIDYRPSWTVTPTRVEA